MIPYLVLAGMALLAALVIYGAAAPIREAADRRRAAHGPGRHRAGVRALTRPDQSDDDTETLPAVTE